MGRRVAYRFPRLARLGLLAGILAASAWATDSRLTLRNGAQVQAEVVKETPETLFVDFGFDLFGIPRSEIASRESQVPASAPVAASSPAAEGQEEEAALQGDTWEQISREALANRKKRGAVQVLDWAQKGVVIVSTPSGFGAGFVIDGQGRILTNQHVVLDEKYVDVTLVQRKAGQIKRDKIKSVEILALSPLMDIALLQLPEEERKKVDLAPLPLAAEGSLAEGDTVYAIGNPGMGREILDFTLSEGIVSALTRNFSEVLYIQTTAAVNPGNSGGPLINDFGEVVGLVSLKAIFQEGIAFALPVDYIRFFLRNQKAFAYGKANPNTGYHYLTPD